MEEQLPYRAEYAKSGRAGCKSCKVKIDQGSLRLAAMVQSAFHDGKQPNWFHMSCFFIKQRPKTVGDIAYFEKLKFEDQKTIKTNIETQQASGAPDDAPTNGKKGKKRPAKSSPESNSLNDFGVEYAKSGRAGCGGCLQKILKDEIRVRKTVFDTDVGMKYGGQPLWHHVDCFNKIRDELGYFECGDKLPGFSKLAKEDQETVRNTIKAQTDVSSSKKLKNEPKNEEEIKMEIKEDKKYIKQNQNLFAWKEHLKSVNKKDLITILERNKQQVPVGLDLLIDSVADILLFGGLPKCTKCPDNGNLYIDKNGYVCLGNMNEWAKCLENYPLPKRFSIQIPSKIKEMYSCFSKYKSKVGERIFQYVAPSGSMLSSTMTVKKEEAVNGPRVQREKPKLYNMEFFIFGKTKMKKDDLKRLVAKLGGTVVTKIHNGVTAVISDAGEVEKLGSRMENIKSLGIHVINEQFFDKVVEAPDAVELIKTDTICDWGTDPTNRIKTEDNKPKSMYSKSSKSSKITLKLTGSGAVDPQSELDDISHVYESPYNKLKYNAVLACTDIQAGKNSYYKLQVLESNSGKRYWLFRSWGRIGTTIGSHIVEDHHNVESAVDKFNALFMEKTMNDFESGNFEKYPGCYAAVDIDYSDGTDGSNKMDIKSDIQSKLELQVQALIKLLFDVDMMKKVMLEFELDTEKMPLGKLSKTQINNAYSVLKDLSQMIAKGASQHDFIGASNRFYTLIPHDFGVNQPILLETNELIKTKVEMLDSLMEIELAYSMITKAGNDTSNPINSIDSHYDQLKTEIKVLDKSTKEFEILRDYVKNTHAETHNTYDLDIEDVFVVQREGENKRYKPFKKLHNRKLLWHGSRLTNWVGILSHGLKIAPPEAPVTGYMFGKGIYFADMVSKSANYCFTSKQNNTGLLMLCEVALGDMKEYTEAHYVTKLPDNKHSTKGIGKTCPHPAESHKNKDGVEIPMGQPFTDNKLKTSLLYNEYIVYDVSQVKCQYLLKVKFNYKY